MLLHKRLLNAVAGGHVHAQVQRWQLPLVPRNDTLKRTLPACSTLYRVWTAHTSVEYL